MNAKLLIALLLASKLTFAGCYEDVLNIVIQGNSIQARIAKKTFSTKIAKSFLGFSELEKKLDVFRSRYHGTENFWKNAMDFQNNSIDISESSLKNIPKEGPAIIVSNHPYGFADGIAVNYILENLVGRDDVMTIGNDLLVQIFPEISSKIYAVDILSPRSVEVIQKNKDIIEKAKEHVRNGGALVIFPAGEISHLADTANIGSKEALKNLNTFDKKWKSTVVTMMKETNSPIIPLHVDGSNSKAFHKLGKINPMLRTVRIVKEYLALQGEVIKVRAGEKVLLEDLPKDLNDKELAEALRQKTFLAGGSRAAEVDSLKVSLERQAKEANRSKKLADIIEQPQTIKESLNDAISSGKLKSILENEKFQIYVGEGSDLEGDILDELGRLRETTFRSVQEGSGKAKDIDKYDLYYHHLIAVDKETNEIVGAYRMGLLDKIVEKHGAEGVYSSLFFGQKKEFYDQVEGKFIEMGRSFVIPEMQSTKALDSLWQGFFTYLKDHPQYMNFIGPVSISGAYSELSKKLIYEFFMKNFKAEKTDEFLKHIVNENPFNGSTINDAVTSLKALEEAGLVKDVKGLNAVIKAIEAAEGNEVDGIPQLYKHYTGLMSGKFIDFNVDDDFNTLDGLILVRTYDINPKILGRFMGSNEAAKELLEKQKALLGK
ncbi:acyltransferase [Bacteriovorax sp. BSW11_IV]|uniref:lysophospholipid acyltransferase family protein n=1 Tax=Bacteriovorax sp. BSW11_IV TaxID=1353529 RepID=UPI00038A3EAE|nr:lysophospholipid acyltransferase family protein [Bacteriovorax sp. BSW11_IV]EQC50339.1 acyltransferase [Bacteriovorax sp. BSW11_IV]